MDFYCPNCGKITAGDIYLETETVIVAGCTFKAPQKHAFCAACGTEVQSDILAEENDYVARHAYCILKSRGG